MRGPAIRAAGLALTCLLTSSCALPLTGDHTRVKDEAGLALNRQRLSLAVEDLESVNTPPGTHAMAPAATYGCTLDSGEVFEPEASQEWALTDRARGTGDPESTGDRPSALGQRAMEQIAAQLIARGWSGTARVEQPEDGVYAIDLHRTFGDHRISLSMQGFSDSIIAVAKTTPEHVCDHSS